MRVWMRSKKRFVVAGEIEIYVQSGLAKDAESELEKAKLSRREDAFLTFCLGMVYAADGRRAEAGRIVKELESKSESDLRMAAWIARIYATLHERDQALTWLERGFEANAIALFYKDAPVWDPIRSDPRFTRLVRRMGVPG